MMDDETRLEEVITEYLRSLETDREIDRQQLTARHPDLAGELEAFFEDHDRMERFARDVRIRAGIDAADGTPRTFGDYELQEEIDRGGMGIIWKARQISLRRTVALKMLLPGQGAGAEYVRRFRTEAEAVADLSHKNIVPIYEIGEQEGQHYFSMKLIEGGSLADHIGRFREDLREAIPLLVTVALTIRFAHQRGILHRDLKPANILLDKDGEPHITDFGLAKRIAEDSSLTMSGVIMGTASYMAPEQACGESKRVTWAADVYSLGAILYEVLTGVPPFRAATAHQTLREVCEKEPVRPSARNPGVDRDLETICLKCLEKDPDRRYESARDFADDLDRWQRGYPIQARRIGRSACAWRWCRRNRAVAGLLATTSVLLLTAMTLLVMGVIDIRHDREMIFRAAVEAQADLIGVRLRNFERTVNQYRKAAVALMAMPAERLPHRGLTPAGRDGVYLDEDYYDEKRRPPNMSYEQAYGTDVSWEHATVVFSPKARLAEHIAEAERDARRLARLNTVFSQVHPEYEDIQWSLAACESGVMAGFPGFGRFEDKPGFDPCEREWYRTGIQADTGDPVWTRPYADASTQLFMLSCVVPIHVEGQKLGVVGIDIPMRRIQDWMQDVSDAPEQTRWLAIMPFSVDDPLLAGSTIEYRVFVDTEYAATAPDWAWVLDRTRLENLRAPLGEYARAVADGRVAAGTCRSIDGLLMAHARIETLNWIVIAIRQSSR